MPHYVAIVEDAGSEKATGIWFPDLPGCFSAGDDVDEALRNAEEALTLYAEAEAREGRELPSPRALSELRNDPSAAADLRDHMWRSSPSIGPKRTPPSSTRESHLLN